jgi:hypothetical protein
MSETALRVTPAVNIDEFERRLRATGSLIAQQEDPLAELARLLGAEDAAPASSAAPAVEAPKSRTEPAPPSRPPILSAESDQRRVVNIDFGGEPSASAPKPPPIPDHAPDFEIEAASDEAADTHVSHLAESMAGAEETPRPRRKVWAMSVLVLIGAVGATGAWFYRGGAVPGLGSRTPPFIMAASGPTKVQPPSQDTVSSPNDVASLLGKEQPIKPAAATITSSQEQPVDLNERAKAQASAEARAAAPAPSPPTIAAAPLVVVAAPPAGSNATTSTSSAPVTSSVGGAAAPAPAIVADASPTRSIAAISSNAAPITPSSTTIQGGTGSAAPAPPTPFPEPKRVKTISVRPDGSEIGAPSLDRADQKPIEPAFEQPVNPPKPVVRPPIDASAPEPATPKLDLPSKPTKSTTRVPIAKIDTTAATATSQSPEAPTQPALNSQHESSAKKREAATKVASAEPPPVVAAPVQAPPQSAPESAQPKSFLSAIFGGNSQEQPPAPIASEPPKPVKTATAEATPASDGGGGYAVQLAAPGSEAEAESMSNRLRTKYASELSGIDLSVHKAVIKDKTVYRVRAGDGMSKSAAVSLCEKLKAAGGACFLARQ